MEVLCACSATPHLITALPRVKTTRALPTRTGYALLAALLQGTCIFHGTISLFSHISHYPGIFRQDPVCVRTRPQLDLVRQEKVEKKKAEWKMEHSGFARDKKKS